MRRDYVRNRDRTLIKKWPTTEQSSQKRSGRIWNLVDLLGVFDVGQSLEEATLAQDTLPELHADDAKYEEDEEAE